MRIFTQALIFSYAYRVNGSDMQRIEVQPVRRVVNIHDDPVVYYLSRLAPDNTAHVASQLRFFWLVESAGWLAGWVTPRQRYYDTGTFMHHLGLSGQ